MKRRRKRKGAKETNGDEQAIVRKALKQRRSAKQVTPVKTKKADASPHAITVESDALRAHAARWMQAHGKAHVALVALVAAVPAKKRQRGGTPAQPSKVVQVQYRGGPRHSGKHVLISPRGRILGEQG